MTHDPRPHIRRRGRAIDRLRSLTTGAAIAGLAGTAGFGILAAESWSGTAPVGATDTRASEPGLTDTGGSSVGTAPRTAPTSVGAAPRPAPTSNGAARQPTTTAPRVQRGSGPGHASSGGSG
jgi:hypothetical protein